MDVKPFGGCSKEEGLVRGTNRYVFGQRLYEGISTKERGVAIFGRQNAPAAGLLLCSICSDKRREQKIQCTGKTASLSK